MYRANGIPLYFGLLSIVLSTFIHLMIMSGIIMRVAPAAFHARIPEKMGLYAGRLALFIIVSLSIGSVLGILVKNQAKLTMISQLTLLA